MPSWLVCRIAIVPDSLSTRVRIAGLVGAQRQRERPRPEHCSKPVRGFRPLQVRHLSKSGNQQQKGLLCAPAFQLCQSVERSFLQNAAQAVHCFRRVTEDPALA